MLPFPGSVTVTCTADSAPARDVRAARAARRVGAASGEIKIERTPTFAGHRRLPVPEPLDPGHAEVERQRRGQGREGRRPAPGLPRPCDEVPDHGHARATPTRSRTATAPPPNPVDPTHARGGRERSSSARTTTPGIKAKATYREYPARDGLRRGPRGCRAASSASDADDRAGDGRRRGLRRAGAEARRRARATPASRSATRRTSATASSTRSTSTSRPRPAGTPTRRSSSSGKLPQAGLARHA